MMVVIGEIATEDTWRCRQKGAPAETGALISTRHTYIATAGTTPRLTSDHTLRRTRGATPRAKGEVARRPREKARTRVITSVCPSEGRRAGARCGPRVASAPRARRYPASLRERRFRAWKRP